jgi:hypothetical protein
MACRDDFSFHFVVIICLPGADGMNIYANVEEVNLALVDALVNRHASSRRVACVFFVQIQDTTKRAQHRSNPNADVDVDTLWYVHLFHD